MEEGESPPRSGGKEAGARGTHSSGHGSHNHKQEERPARGLRSRIRAARHRDKPRTDLGEQITAEHRYYHLTYGMMLGIRVSVGKAVLTRSGFQVTAEILQTPDLSIDDFMHVEKYVFPPQGSANTPPHKLLNPFKFKDYSPLVFRHLRERFGIDGAEYMLSLCGDFGYIEFISNSKGGQFFFYSHDGRYMIKTQTREASKFLRRIMPHYYKYVMENPNTLLTRIYGMHRVKMHDISQRMHFVIMQSVFDTEKEIHEKFDLKGSLVNRFATEEEKAKPDCVLKDVDLNRRGLKIKLGPKRKMFLEQLRRDAEFLASLGIMDYSLLLGVHYRSKAHVKGVRKRSVHMTETEREALRATLEDGGKEGLGSGEVSLSDDEWRGGPSASSEHRRTSRESSSEHAPPRDSAHSESGAAGAAGAAGSGGELRRARRPTLVDPSIVHYPAFTQDNGGIASVEPDGRPADEMYFVGIIDILQQYNTRKMAETFFKGFKYDRNQISAVSPERYAERFVRFMEEHTV